MFTPQRKVWLRNQRSEPIKKNVSGSGGNPNLITRNGESAEKGKGVALVESTPSKGTLGENGMDMEKVSQLENELFEYQYNMGLLLIEKKEWTAKLEELQQVLAETKDALRREQASHSIATSEVEKREENLRKALGVEKQCVLDLEKALREMRAEYAEIKFTADSKLAEANALSSSIEEKALEVEAKLHGADAKLAEVSRKSSDIERKAHELEARENVLRRERLSFNTEREAHEGNLSKQRDELREWERKLQEGEERLAEVRRLLNQREERANENDRIFKQKQADLEETQKKIDIANISLKEKEDDISTRIGNLTLKEKEADAMQKRIELKEKELLELEGKLDDREQVEIQKLLDEHNAILDAKKRDFELEMEEKRRSFDADLKNKVVEVEKKEVEIKHTEEKIAKREQALVTKLEKSKEKENDLELKLKSLKEKEKFIKVEEKNLENERKQLLSDKENLINLKAELEQTRANIEEQRLKINEEIERLQVTEEDRSEHARLQSELKQEIDKCRIQRELLLKEGDDLKQEREKFEKEWEELDEKRAEIQKELESLTQQKEKLEKLKHAEEERLNNEKLETQNYVQRELESLKLAKDSFEATMEHEKSVMAEKIQNERTQMLRDFEVQKRELETEMQNTKEEMENRLNEREKLFEEERERELNNINYLREVAHREMEDMKLERQRIEKEKNEISANQKHLEGQQFEMRKDIEELVGLSKKLKEQREQFLKERERFIQFVGKHKSCKNCEEITSEFMLTDLQSLAEVENAEEPFPLPKLADEYLKQAEQCTSERPSSEITPGVINSGSPMSWLRKCTSKIFVFSASKKNDNVKELKTSMNAEDKRELSVGVASESFDVRREAGTGPDPSADEMSNMNSKTHDIMEDSQHSHLQAGPQKTNKRRRPRVNRSRSVKATVLDAKARTGDAIEHNESEHVNGIAENSNYMNEESRESSLVGKGTSRNGRKRNRKLTSSEQDSDYDEVSDSVTGGGRRKRRQRIAPVVQPGKRYNLRRPKTVAAVAAVGMLLDAGKEKEKEADGGGMREEIPDSNAQPAPSTGVASENAGSTHLVNMKAIKSSADAHVFSLDGDLRSKTAANSRADNIDAKNKFVGADISEEVNGGTPGRGPRVYGNEEEQGCETPRNNRDDEDDDSGDDDEEEEEEEHPGEASMSKKLWTFLTT
ncbi:hypothetical protein LguiB_009110 [Lonicera macranthoides]